MDDTPNRFSELYPIWLEHAEQGARRWCADVDLAQELAHSLLVELWVTGRWATVQHPKPYLEQAVRLMAQHRHGLLTRQADIDELHEVASASPDPLETTAASERAAAMERALSALSTGHREVMLLAVHRGWTSSRIAMQLGITRKAVERRKDRARRELRAWFVARGSPDAWLPD